MNPSARVTASLLLVASFNAAAAPAGIEARQAPSCGEWVVHRSKSDTLALGNASWLLGYLSGIAIANGKDYLAGTENAAIYKWMDDYCKRNPLRDVSAGGNSFIAEAGAKKAAAK